MKVTTLCVIGAICLGTTGSVLANNVIIASSTPIDITYQVARVNGDGQPVLSGIRSMKVNHTASIDCELNGYERSGVVLVSVNGHQLPTNINQFNQPRQCSMTTDAGRSAGALEITTSQHSIKCATHGGVFG